MLTLSELLIPRRNRRHERKYEALHRDEIRQRQREYAKTPERKAKNLEAVKRYRSKHK